MKSSFLKKVAVLSAGAIVLSSVSFMDVNASTGETKQTTLTGTCNGVTQIQKTHNVDFGSFTTSEVTAGTKTQAGTKTGASTATSLSASEGGVVTDRFISVKDDCGNKALWTLSMQLSDLTSSAGHKAFGDNITYTWSTNYFILAGLNVANSEVDAKLLNRPAGWPTVYNPSYSSTGNTTVALLTRTQGGSPNFYGAEYGVNLFFQKRLPQYQPAGTYTGTMFISLVY
jgi:hypothetical protein